MSPWPCRMSPSPGNGGAPLRFFWDRCWAFFLLQPEQGAGLIYVREWVVGGDERSVPLSPAALGEEALGAEGGRGLASSAVRTQGALGAG